MLYGGGLCGISWRFGLGRGYSGSTDLVQPPFKTEIELLWPLFDGNKISVHFGTFW